MNKSSHFPFLISVFGGVFVWLFIFTLFPAKVVSPIANESFWFIFLSYCSIVLGYFIFPKIINSNNSLPTISKKIINYIIVVALLSYLIRYIDFFLYRKVSFANNVWQNRTLLESTKPGFIFIIASVLKQLYFVPIIFLFRKKIKDKKILIIAYLLFLLPFVEGFIRGSRNSFFTPVVLLLFTLFYFNKIKFKVKPILIIATVVAILFFIATSIIMDREANKTDENYSSLTTDFFLNQFLKPSPLVFEKIHKTKNPTVKKMKVSSFQIAQYYVHGVFEFDNLIKYYKKEPIKYQYGRYNFFIINRFTNKYGLTNNDLEENQFINPRGITFITFFGGLYVDFGWFGVFVMLLYGRLQRFVKDNISAQNCSYIPLFIFFLFSNFFMLTFNFIKSTGTSIIVVCLSIIFTVSLFRNFKK